LYLGESWTERVREEGDGLRILVVRLGAMGDILRTLPAVRLVRRALPRAEIRFVLDDKWAGVIRNHPDLDGIVELPRRRFEELFRSPRRWGTLLDELARWRDRLRQPRPDLLLDFHGNLRSGVVGALSGAQVRLGHAGHQQKEGNRLFTTARVPAGKRRTSRLERNLDLVRAMGLPDRPLPGGGLPEDRDAAVEAEQISGQDTYAVLCPGASVLQAYKKPPAALLAGAAAALGARSIGSLVVHGPGEEEDAAAVVRAAEGAATLAPPTSLAVLMELLRRARLFVGGDTGPLHMACAVGCPVIGIYGPTDPAVNSPWGVRFEQVVPEGRIYTGIKKLDRRSGGFDGIRPDAVADAVTRLLDERRSP
jgi:ADP-heptose:LPS heptosyltransferase